MQRDIFISYSRKDIDLVKQIKGEIEKSIGVQCWMDITGIESGSPRFTKDIVNGINNCKVFLFMLSGHSQESEFALRELSYGYKRRDTRGIHVVIVNIDNCRLQDEFEFMYGLTDTILWSDVPQHDKLMKDLKGWIAPIDKAEADSLARKIAHLYLNKFPRLYSYGVKLVSSEDDSEGTFYFKLNNEELEVLKGFVNRPEEDLDIDLHEWLEAEEQNELLDKLLDVYSPFQLNLLSDVDLDHPLKFTRFVVRGQKSDGTLTNPEYIGVDLTDDEYVDIMTDLLKSSNHYSVNMMVYKRPEIAQKIMSHIVGVYLDGIGDYKEPFLCDLYELKVVVKSILDPFEDKLQLFESDDEGITKFVTCNQICPAGAGEEIYSEYSENDSYHCVLNFNGPYMILDQEGIKDSGEWHDTDYFKYDARIALKKFGLEKPEELFPYLKKHYNSRDCLSSIRKFLTGC